MTDTPVTKVSSAHSPAGDQGEVYLASGKRLSMRMWRYEPPSQDKPTHRQEYEVIGYVISGRAELEIEGQIVWLSQATPGWYRPDRNMPTATWKRSLLLRQPLLPPKCMDVSRHDILAMLGAQASSNT